MGDLSECCARSMHAGQNFVRWGTTPTLVLARFTSLLFHTWVFVSGMLHTRSVTHFQVFLLHILSCRWMLGYDDGESACVLYMHALLCDGSSWGYRIITLLDLAQKTTTCHGPEREKVWVSSTTGHPNGCTASALR